MNRLMLVLCAAAATAAAADPIGIHAVTLITSGIALPLERTR